MRLRLVVLGVVSAVTIALLPTLAAASLRTPQTVIAVSDTQMKWTSCGNGCTQGIDTADSISAVFRDNVMVLGEELSHADSKATLEETASVLSKAANGYGGARALSWVAGEMKIWAKSAAPFQATGTFKGRQFTFGGWAGDGSIALTVVFG